MLGKRSLAGSSSICRYWPRLAWKFWFPFTLRETSRSMSSTRLIASCCPERASASSSRMMYSRNSLAADSGGK
ncbi:hypothetical protein D3C79_1090450 [compost metagenome]